MENEVNSEKVREQYDEAAVRTALGAADVNVLRVALYQQTGDTWLAEVPVQRQKIPGSPYEIYSVPKEYHEKIVNAAVVYVLDPDAPVNLSLSQDEVRHLAEIFEGEQVNDSVAGFVYEEMAFDGFKRFAKWSSATPDIPDDFSVLIIGAGFSSVICAIQLDQLGIDYRIIERQQDWGGTWCLNSYPDARVDITNFIYSYTLEPDYPWDHAFAPRDELLKYINYMVDKYDLRSRAVFNTKITAAEWDSSSDQWRVDIENTEGSREQITPNVVLSCAGLFSTPKLPSIKGIESFKGAMFHTTNWDHDYNYTGKKVAIIGTGSTGSQLLRRVAEEADFVAVYQRTPNWVTPVGRYRAPIPEARKLLLKIMPGYSNWFRYSHVQAVRRLVKRQCRPCNGSYRTDYFHRDCLASRHRARV